MSAPTMTFDEPGLGLELPSRGALTTAAKKLGWLGITGLTVTAAALFGMAVAVVAALGTVVVAAVALVCVVVGAAALAALLIVVAAGLVIAGALALALGVVAGTLAAGLAVSGWVGRGVRAIFERFGVLRGRRFALVQDPLPSESSAS